MGRKTLLTPAVQQRIVEAVRAGAYLEDAAAYCGLPVSTVTEWMARGHGRDPDRPQTKQYAAFAAAVDEARAAARLEHVLIIRQAARAGQWQASAWFLERTAPKLWGRKDRMTVEGGEPDKPLRVAVRDEHAEDVARTIRDGLAALPMRSPDE